MDAFTESLKVFKNKVSGRKCDTLVRPQTSVQSDFYIVGIH